MKFQIILRLGMILIVYGISHLLYSICFPITWKNAFPGLKEIFLWDSSLENPRERKFQKASNEHTTKPQILENEIRKQFPAVVVVKEIQTIYSPLNLPVKQVHVKVGDFVGVGKTLITLDNTSLLSELEKTKAQLEVLMGQLYLSEIRKEEKRQVWESQVLEIEKKVSVLQNLKMEKELSHTILEGKKSLLEQGHISKMEYQKWQSEDQEKTVFYENAKREKDYLITSLFGGENYKNAEEKNIEIYKQNFCEKETVEVQILEKQIRFKNKEVSELQKNLERTRVAVNKPGRILSLSIGEGEWTQNKELVQIQLGNQISAQFYVNESNLRKLHVGKTLHFSPALSDENRMNQEIPITIGSVGTYLDPKTHTVLVRADFPKGDNRLIPGMFGSVFINSGEKSRHIYIPFSFVGGNERDGYHVFLKKAEGIQKQLVRIQVDEDYQIEVLSGLEGNELLVLPSTNS